MPAMNELMNRLRSRKRIVVIAAALAALAGGAAAIAAAQDSPSSRADSYLERVAGHLGVSTDELEAAMKAAALDEVDAAVEEGRLTEEQADALKERIESGGVPPFFGPLLGPRHEHGFGVPGRLPFHGLFLFEEHLSTAAGYLELSEGELRERLNEGDTLADVAEAEGKSVDGLEQALVAAARERLDQAVEDGDLSRAEADRALEGLEERVHDLVEHASFRFHEDGTGLRAPGAGPFS